LPGIGKQLLRAILSHRGNVPIEVRYLRDTVKTFMSLAHQCIKNESIFMVMFERGYGTDFTCSDREHLDERTTGQSS
jgi:hypothetical protein